MKVLRRALIVFIFFVVGLKPFDLAAQTQFFLTEMERDYLNMYGEITLCVDPD